MGLGKTIAKGVAARAIAHLRETTDRTDDRVHLLHSQIAARTSTACASSPAARRRPTPTDHDAPADDGLRPAGGVDLIAFTPARSASATRRTSRRTRALHWMLSHSIDRLWLMQDRIIDYFRDAVGFQRLSRLEWDWSQPALDD